MIAMNPHLQDDTEMAVERDTVMEPQIAVIIPAYKQPEFLKDAVLSATRQTIRDRLKVVIINDGCPYERTDWLGKFFQRAFPGEVYYLKQRNGGVSAARNTAIKFALECWPSIQAIFPLDADNRLEPDSLEKYWNKLNSSAPETGWVYPDLEQFGFEDSQWHTGLPFNFYRLIDENFCDNGSLLRRDVFEKGVWYDEKMLGGYEDWEFFVNASAHGFRGVHLPKAGFLYRRTGHSRNEGAKEKHDSLCRYIKTKHALHLGRDRLVELEQTEMPRFAIVDTDAGVVRFTTDPNLTTSCHTISTFAQMLADYGHQSADSNYVPPIILFVKKDGFELLQRLRVLPAIMLTGQTFLKSEDHFAVSLDLADDPHTLQLAAPPSPGDTVLVGLSTRRFVESAFGRSNDTASLFDRDRTNCPVTLRLRVGLAYFNDVTANARTRLLTSIYASVRKQAQLQHCGNPAPLLKPDPIRDLSQEVAKHQRAFKGERRQLSIYSHSDFALAKHVESGKSVFPSCGATSSARAKRPNVFFVTAWIGLGGLDQIVLNFAQELANLKKGYNLHLVCTERMSVEADPRWLTFDSISFLPTAAEEKKRMLTNILSSADVIINAHSMQAYEILPELQSDRKIPYISLLQVVDLDQRGYPCGYPLIAARDYGNLIDSFLVPSHQLKRSLMNLGVPEEKVAVIPNAPVVFPPTLESALALTQKKSRRTGTPEQPLQVLFCGRFDYQKGFDRLAKIAALLRQSGVTVDFKVVGKPVLSKSDIWMDIPGARFLPASVDRDVLAAHYTEADIYLLPSRFEGVPLGILEAMCYGNIVVTTDVGASNEVVVDGENGFLINPHKSEDEIAADIRNVISDIARGPRQYRAMRIAACKTGMSVLWKDAATLLEKLITQL